MRKVFRIPNSSESLGNINDEEFAAVPMLISDDCDVDKDFAVGLTSDTGASNDRTIHKAVRRESRPRRAPIYLKNFVLLMILGSRGNVIVNLCWHCLFVT